eukprot:s4154_g2.t1
MFCQIRETDTRDSRLEAPSLMGSDSSSPEQVPRLSGKRLGPMGRLFPALPFELRAEGGRLRTFRRAVYFPSWRVQRPSADMMMGMSRSMVTMMQFNEQKQDYVSSLSNMEEDTPEYNAALQECHKRGAERCVKVANQHRGLYVKAAQFIASIRGGTGERGVPKPYTDALAVFTDHAPHKRIDEVAEAIRAGYPVDNAFFREFGERMSRIHSQEEGTHRRQCQAAQTASKSWSLGTCIDDAKQDEEGSSRASLEGSFLQTVKKSWKRLSEVLPDTPDSQPRDAEALCDTIRALQLEESTLKLFRASGAWFFDPPTATERPGQLGDEAAKAPEEEDEEKLMELEAKSRSDYNLGVRLLKGKGTEKDEVEAARCFREAADLGHLKASYALGVMLLNGQGVGKDEVLAGAYLKQAAQAGDPKAMYNLSLMYQNAVGVKRDLDVAKEWMEQAAKRGHKKALRSKSIKVFGAGPWMDYDPDEMGVDRIVKEAEAGNTHAQFRLGSMYYEGEKFAPDKAQASYWFMQAAQAGLPEAQYQISRMLFLGDGVEADAEYAMRFLKLAAERGHVESMHNLGVKLYFGDGIGNDRRTAASWFLKASEQGFPQSQNNLGWMLYCGDGVPMNTQEGLKWLEKAASAGNQEAQYHLLSVRGTMISGD